MKIIYTILFFADTVLLILLAFLLLHLSDKGIGTHLPSFFLVALAMLFCIILLVFFLNRYTTSSSDSDELM